jgi:Uma2 family endonuclease
VATVENITSAEQLFAAGNLGRCELVRGELIMMSPAGASHGRIVLNLSTPLDMFVRQHSLGMVFAAETGFRIGQNPDTVRAPDVAFVSAERSGGELAPGFFPGPPDLAVEVLSPEDRAGEVLAKVQDWLAAGCRAVWVVDPRTQTVTVYRGPHDIAVLGRTETLDGGGLLPGFSLPVSQMFQQ